MSVNFEKSHLNPRFGTFNSQLLGLEKGYHGFYLKHIPHYSVSKLNDSTPQDLVGEPLFGLESTKSIFFNGAIKDWSQLHSCTDLFNGCFYNIKLLEVIGRQKTHLFREFSQLYNEIYYSNSSFLGKVGGFSKYYHEFDPERTLKEVWDVRYSEVEDFFVGCTGVFTFLENLKSGGDLATIKKEMQRLLAKKIYNNYVGSVV